MGIWHNFIRIYIWGDKNNIWFGGKNGGFGVHLGVKRVKSE